METDVDTTEKLPTVLSFCSGYGGIERGLDLAGVKHRVLAYVEIEAFAIANLVAKMESGQLPPAPVYTDIKTFPSHLFRGAVDLITGGYPCQPFSAAGQRKGADDPRHLWPFISHHIGIINPSRVFFENVEGHISLGLSTVLADLEDRSYDTTWGIFSACEVGAPHQRKRVYIMGDTFDWQNNPEWRPTEQGRDTLGRGEQTPQRKDGEACADSPYRPGSGARPWDMGDSEHYGPLGAAFPRSSGQTVRNDSQGQNEACELEGASTPPLLADSSREGLQGCRDTRDLSSEEQKPADELSARRGAAQGGEWPPEPRVGRVVDGCADRVDRIRLLGNGVVPQTAAKAWEVLSMELCAL